MFRRPDDLRIDEEQRGLRLLRLAGDVDGDDTHRLAYLDRRQPDAGGLVHGPDHAVHEAPGDIVDGFDGGARLAQDGVGNREDFEIGHWGREIGVRGVGVNLVERPMTLPLGLS